MDRIKSIWVVASNNLRKLPINPRIYIVLIAISAYMYLLAKPIIEFSVFIDQNITPYVYPYLMTNSLFVVLSMLGVIMLFCDAPFVEGEHPYLVMRTGRLNWCLGQILYIFITSLLYNIVIIIITIIPILGHIEWSTGWGKAIATLAQVDTFNSISDSGTLSYFTFTIYNYYSPIQAMLLTLLMSTLVTTMLGMIMFAFNTVLSRYTGVLVAGFFVVFTLSMQQLNDLDVVKYSPVSWISLSKIDYFYDATFYLPIQQAIGILLLIIVALAFIAYNLIKKRDIEVLKSV